VGCQDSVSAVHCLGLELVGSGKTTSDVQGACFDSLLAFEPDGSELPGRSSLPRTFPAKERWMGLL